MRRFAPLMLLALVSPASFAQDSAPAKKVLVIGIDGCRPDALEKAHTPHLDRLIRAGAYSAQARTGDITISGPGWGSLLTGVWRGKHGIRDNRFEGHNLKEFPHFFVRLKEKKPRARTVSLVHWTPIHQHLLAACDLAAAFKKDAQVAERALEVLRQDAALDVLFLHFDEVDGAGHRHGFDPDRKEYLQAIERTDAYVGKLVGALQARPDFAREDWLILSSTDHGGSEKGHGKNIPTHRTIFFLAWGPSVRPGPIAGSPGIVDVAATALAHLTGPLDPRWRLDGRPVGLKAFPPEN